MPFLWPVTAWNNLKYTCVELLYIESLFFPPDSNKNIHFQNWSGRQFTTYCLLPERPRFGLKIIKNEKMPCCISISSFLCVVWFHFRQLFLRLGHWTTVQWLKKPLFLSNKIRIWSFFQFYMEWRFTSFLHRNYMLKHS